ncbi:MAG: DUF86 domain-containing protein [Candidatus Nanohaloarchaea archaeon]
MSTTDGISLEREERYREKLEKLEELIRDLEEWHTGAKDLLKDKAMRRAVYKSFQEAAEVVSDLCAMYLSDAGKVLGDDSDNIEKAAGDLFDSGLRDGMLEVNGLRNRVVHDYNGFDDRTALESIPSRLGDIRSFRQEVEEWVESS